MNCSFGFVQYSVQARILEWVVFPFSGLSSQPSDRIQVSRTAGGFFTSWAIRETPIYCLDLLNSLEVARWWYFIISFLIHSLEYFYKDKISFTDYLDTQERQNKCFILFLHLLVLILWHWFHITLIEATKFIFKYHYELTDFYLNIFVCFCSFQLLSLLMFKMCNV